MNCPSCGRTVIANGLRYKRHSITHREADTCPMSEQPVPPTGDTPEDHETRAGIVMHLAGQLRDCDPAMTWQYLTAIPSAELQRLLVVALAAIPLESKRSELFGWVQQLGEVA